MNYSPPPGMGPAFGPGHTHGPGEELPPLPPEYLVKEGIKRLAIERAMKAEKLKDMKKAGEGKSLDEIDISPEETKTYMKRAYKEAKFPKPRNLVGMQKDLPVEEMEKLMMTNLPATDDDIKDLATRRAEVVQNWLTEQGKVAPARVFLLPAKLGAADKGKGNRAEFSLR